MSRTGNVVFLAGGAIYWHSRRQNQGADKVSPSSAHAEIKSLCSVTRDLIGIRQFLDELGIARTGPTVAIDDNQDAKARSQYRRGDTKTKAS